MEVKLKQVLFLNLCFRIFLLLCVLKDNNVVLQKPRETRPLVQKLKPISKRVVLVFINGLGANFLKANSTPFIQKKLEDEGASAVALIGNMQTNYWGMKAVLTGSPIPSIPYSWMDGRNETILDYLDCKCGMGNLPEDFPLKNKDTDENFIMTFDRVMPKNSNKSCLWVISNDLDPIYVEDYPKKLKEFDDEIRHFATLTDAYYNDGETTYIVTSGRGTPVGDSLTVDVPVVMWGKGIAHTAHVEMLKQGDITAMLCALLGISFPTGLVGTVHRNLMIISKEHAFELTSYTIKHYENVLRAVDFSKFVVNSSKLTRNQLFIRLDYILKDLNKANFRRSLIESSYVILLLSLWGVILTTGAFSGHLSFFINLKQLFLLLLVVNITLVYIPDNREFIITTALLLYWICQNGMNIFAECKRNFWLVISVVVSVFVGFLLGRFIRNEFALLFMLAPVVLWPLINGSFRYLNRFVMISRLLSGFSVGVIQFSRIFGERVEVIILACISFVFVFNFYLLFSIFKRPIDLQVKIISVMICVTVFQMFLIHRSEKFSRDELSILLLMFSLLSAYETFGTILERLLKIYLSFLIPVLMFSVKDECIFYFAMVFHTFTWIFIEYHFDKSSELQYNPSVFSVEPKNNTKSLRFSRKDIRVVAFYLIYSYTSYFAMGHNPDLISYDLYVLPAFVYKYPKIISYFLAVFKFFLPFFITTTSFVVFCGVKEKPTPPMMMMSLWMSDVIGCGLIFFSQFVNRALPFVFRINYSNFILLQCAAICAILSYFVGEHLLFGPEKFLQCVFRGKKRQEKVTS